MRHVLPVLLAIAATIIAAWLLTVALIRLTLLEPIALTARLLEGAA